MILKMSRVQIWGLKALMDKTIRILHDFGGMQIDDIHDVPDTMIKPFVLPESLKEKIEQLDLLTANINGLVDQLDLRKKEIQGLSPSPDDENLREIKDRVSQIMAQMQYLNNRKKELQDELVSLSKYRDLLSVIAPALPESAKKSGNATIRALIPSSQMRAMSLLEQQLKLITHGKFEMISVKVGGTTNAVIGIFPLELISQVESFIKKEKITQLILPEEYAYLSTEEAIQSIDRKIELNHTELDEIDDRTTRIADNWLPRLKIWQLVCQDQKDEYKIYSKIGETDFTFTIIGWVPTEKMKAFDEIIHKHFGLDVIVNLLSVPEELKDRTPVATRNPKEIQPFEHFVKMRAVPKYSDIDPSILVAIFMPLFFGMMVGDVGYGIIMFILAIVFSKKMKEGLFADFFNALRLGALWSILFGVLFGEYFGTLGEQFGIPPLWISRSSASSVNTLLIMALAVGVGHVMFGLILGIWTSAVHKSKNHFLERLGMLIGLIGVILLAGSITRTLPDGTKTLGWVTLVVGLVTLGASLGKPGIFLSPIEFVGVIGNILSYLRIAALGLASVFLAKVANDLGNSIGSVAVGVLIALLIHSLNLVMGMLSPTIQSLRLQYVEFFRKFYEGGNTAFSPFRRRISTQKFQKTTK